MPRSAGIQNTEENPVQAPQPVALRAAVAAAKAVPIRGIGNGKRAMNASRGCLTRTVRRPLRLVRTCSVRARGGPATIADKLKHHFVHASIGKKQYVQIRRCHEQFMNYFGACTIKHDMQHNKCNWFLQMEACLRSAAGQLQPCIPYLWSVMRGCVHVFKS